MSTLVPRDGVTFCSTDHGTVLLDTTAGTFFGLDPVAATAWTALATSGEFEGALAAVLTRFEIDEATARGHLDRLITDLRGHNLLASTP